jgi:hypothetical protein
MAANGPARTSEASERPIISPELVLVDPELAQIDHSPLPSVVVPMRVEPLEHKVLQPEDVSAHSPRRGRYATRIGGAALLVSIGFNIWLVRDTHQSPTTSAPSKIAAPSKTAAFSEQPHHPALSTIENSQALPSANVTTDAHQGPAATPATPSHRALPSPKQQSARRSMPLPALSRTVTEAHLPESSYPTVGNVEVHLLASLSSLSSLRDRFLDPNGVRRAAVSARCAQIGSAPRSVPTFRCVVWQRPRPASSGVAVVVRIFRGTRFLVTAR